MLDKTSFDAALKVHYGPQKLKEISFKRRPLLAMVRKYEKFGGKHYPLPLKYASTQNRAATFANAQRSASGAPSSTDSMSLVEFQLTSVENYGLAFVSGKVIKESEGDVNAFLRAVKGEFDSVLEGIADDLHQDLYSDGVGARGQIGSVASATITLTNPEDAVKFEVGMGIEVSTGTPATNALRANPANVSTVVAIDRNAGTVELSAAITGMAANDWIFAYGDRQAGAITASSQWRKLSGLGAWIPSTAPGSTAFFGVDRSVDTLKLGGQRIAYASNIRDTLRKAAIETDRYSGSADTGFMNHTNLDTLLGEMDTKVEYDVIRSPDGIIGFEAVRVITPVGRASIVGDRACPVDEGFLLDLESCVLASAGSAPMNLNLDGNDMLRQSTADAYEARFGYYAQFGCDAPGKNAHLTLA